MEEKIDFVITWVDGSDPAWRAEFERYREFNTPPALMDRKGGLEDANIDATEERYRNWDNLHYLFRTIEKFAPWVNRVHLITWGHLPPWLDASHPKLNIVNHRDFIPEQYLPTFSALPIELNMHRIDSLAEHFVYFNDDMFLCRPVGPERFFRKGLPCDMARLSVVRDERIDHNILECLRVINRRYSKKESVGNNLGKWFNRRYRVGDMIKTLTLMPWSFFTGFHTHHMPQPFVREVLERLWAEEYEELDRTSRDRFRTPTDLSQWLFRYEQLASGAFSPHGIKDTRLYKISDSNADDAARSIVSGKYTMICLNDNNDIVDFDCVRRKISDAFEQLVPVRSGYELPQKS